MRIVIGIDSSEKTLAGLQHILRTFLPTDITFVHGVDLSQFEFPFGAEAASPADRTLHEELRRSNLDAGRQILERATALIPKDSASIHQVCDAQTPAHLILETAKTVAADLIITGTRGHGPVTETLLGSVSHRVLSHATQPTLIVKGTPRPVKRILVAVEGQEDAHRIQSWLSAHPFNNPTEICVLTVPQALRFASAMEFAEKLVETTASAIRKPSYSITARVATGEPGAVLAEESKQFDLLVVGSHGRNKLERFLLGSVSHSVVHRSACSVLVIR
ncbi:MAG: universal stress protein [Nitrospira sp.]|nr:universal stress protein [Nitrospira sp.]